jgi:hypothetical protein
MRAGFCRSISLAFVLCTLAMAGPGRADESTDTGDPLFSREGLEQLSEVLSQASDKLYLLNRANRAYLQSIAPAYLRSGSIAELREMGETNAEIKEFSEFYDRAGKMAELAAAISGDLEDKRPFLSLGSHTIEVALKYAVESATDPDRIAKALQQGLISPLSAKALGSLNLGGGDMIAGAEHLLSQQTDRVEAWATLLDGINKSAWAGLGYAISGGNSSVAKTFSIIGGMAVQSGRTITAPMFTAYNNWSTGADQNLIQIWMTAEAARIRHGEKLRSFEEFYKSDPVILSQVSEADRQSANARLGLASPPPSQGSRMNVEVITRTFSEAYREVCNSGFCVRTDLSLTTPATPPLPLPPPCSVGSASCRPSATPGGVFVAPAPKRAGSINDTVGQGILSLPRLGPGH